MTGRMGGGNSSSGAPFLSDSDSANDASTVVPGFLASEPVMAFQMRGEYLG